MTLTTREPTMRSPNKERSASGRSHKPRSPILRADDWPDGCKPTTMAAVRAVTRINYTESGGLRLPLTHFACSVPGITS